MISARRLKVLSLALLMSGGTFVLTEQWIHQAVRKASAEAVAKAGPPAPAAASQVLVASAPLAAGAIIKPGQVRWQAWPAGASTAGYLTQSNTSLEQMNGAVVRTGVDAGEPLTAARVVQPGDRGFLAAVLKPGYRAVTINVTAATGVAGFALPGDHVDLILPMSVPATNGDRRVASITVLQDVRVLAMDQRGDQAKTGDPRKDVVTPQTATLEVTPKGAEIIATASQIGPLSLSLRSLAEPQTTVPLTRDVTRTNLAEVLGLPANTGMKPKPPSEAPRRRAPSIELFRGTQSVSIPAASSQGGAS